MLLNQIISNQHALYAEIQAQIESLQEQQRQIQAHLQRLGSVESKMESAAQLVAEAIAEINAVCPDELTNYQHTITSLFDSGPIAQLSAGSSEPPDDHSPVAPEPESDTTTTIEASAVTVEDEVATLPETIETLPADTEITGNTTNGNGNGNTNGNGNGHHLLGYDDLKKYDKHTLAKLAKLHGIDGKTKKDDLAQALDRLVTHNEMEEALRSNGRV